MAKIKDIDPQLLRRSRPQEEEADEHEEDEKLTKGTVTKIVDIVLSPSDRTIRSFTNIDPVLAKLLPVLDIIDEAWDNCIAIAAYRYDSSKHKRPEEPKLIKTFTTSLAMWRRSINGKAFNSSMNLALAETETRAGEDDQTYGFNDRL